MPIPHTKLHYAGIALALGLSSVALVQSPSSQPPDVGMHEVDRASRFDWTPLGADKTIALGEALKGVKPGKAIIYCAHSHCQGLMRDLDDALQLADWKSEFEERQVESESSKGLFVGPPGLDAENVKAALEKQGFEVGVVGITDEYGQPIDGVGIIIGKSGNN